MQEGKWITLKDGRHILLKPKEIKMNDTNVYVNNMLRGAIKPTNIRNKKLTKKDIVDGDIYQGADGYWNYDLKDGYLSDFGLPYIWNKTKSGANLELKMVINRENILKERQKG